MTSLALTPAQIGRYLDVLGADLASPSRAALDALVRAQVTRVPFDSISKLYYRKTLGLSEIPPLELYLDGIERFHFGGTCYANNIHFSSLLQSLGYDATLCGADMPSGEDVHCAIGVSCEGHDLLVDVGYAAPFLEPLPRDSEQEVAVRFGRDRYVLSPRDERGCSRLDLYRDGTRIHGYAFKPESRPADHFAPAVRDSFRPDATFMNAVMLTRYSDDASIAIYNLSVIRSTRDRFTIENLGDREQLVAMIEREFEIPAEITRTAVASVGVFGSAYA